jgi:hypothetical protein
VPIQKPYLVPNPPRLISNFPIPSSPAGMTITETLVTLSANQSSSLIAANALRLYLKWQNIGVGAATVAAGVGPVIAGQGIGYGPMDSETFSGSSVPLNAFAVIAQAPTTFIVWEGQ